jgi:hypothetical protein
LGIEHKEARWNGWLMLGVRYVTCNARRLELGQELELRQMAKVLELPI